MTINQIVKGLESDKEQEVSKALAALTSQGDHRVIRPLANLLRTSKDEKIKKEILEVFSSLKSTLVLEEVVSVLKDDYFRPIRQQVLATIWNTSLDYSYYIADFVEIATDGDYLEALDCLTIIEAMAGPFQERHLLESQWHLKEFMEDGFPKEERKMQLISDIALFVKEADFDNENY